MRQVLEGKDYFRHLQQLMPVSITLETPDSLMVAGFVNGIIIIIHRPYLASLFQHLEGCMLVYTMSFTARHVIQKQNKSTD